jgi:putative flippase GtrA
MTTQIKLRHRLFYFISIGVAAAGVHLFTVFNLVHFLHTPALIANIFGFLIAFNISFVGHKHLTFSQLQKQKVLRLPHFFLVATTGGIINELLYFVLLRCTTLNYLLALILVLVCVSIYSVTISRFWACR